MTLLEAIEIIENNKELKNKVIEECISQLGVSIETTTKKVWKHEFLLEDDDWAVMSIEPQRDVEDVHTEIIRSTQLKEYNDIRIAEDIIKEKPFKSIAAEYKVSLKHIRTIKRKIYEVIKDQSE
jgi:hypothetical protein